MKFLSVFSGIEAASHAWRHLGWRAVGFSEIEPFCCELLKQRYPDIPNYGDMRLINEHTIKDAFALMAGGSPCQDFSIAGGRQGLSGRFSKLAAEFIRLAGAYHPRWIVWENVPGVISARGGGLQIHY